MTLPIIILLVAVVALCFFFYCEGRKRGFEEGRMSVAHNVVDMIGQGTLTPNLSTKEEDSEIGNQLLGVDELPEETKDGPDAHSRGHW